MQFSDTSNRINGLLQDCEHWCNFEAAHLTASTSTTVRQLFTGLINRRYDRAMGMIGGNSRTAIADDTNYTNQPFSTFDIVSGQNDYQFLTDASSNSITDITGVLILESPSATEYVTLDKLSMGGTQVNSGAASGVLGYSVADDPNLILSPNPSNTGIPTAYLEQNNTIFFDKIPNYSKTNGGKLFYKRVPSYFAISDTTKAPGFSADHHRILSLGASVDWLRVNKPEQVTLISGIMEELKRAESEFETWVRMRNPAKGRMTVRQDNCQ